MSTCIKNVFGRLSSFMGETKESASVITDVVVDLLLIAAIAVPILTSVNSSLHDAVYTWMHKHQFVRTVGCIVGEVALISLCVAWIKHRNNKEAPRRLSN